MINQLKSEKAIMPLVLCVLAAQIPHAHSVWYYSSTGTLAFEWAHLSTWLFAWLFALGLEFSTLMYVIHSRHLLSYLFALFSVFINIQYFQIVNGETFDVMASRYWLLSIVLPFAIASYSHLCAEYANGEAKVGNVVSWLLEVWPFSLWWGNAQEPAESTATTQGESLIDESESQVGHDATAVTARENAVLQAVRSGASTVYAIAKATDINASALRRKGRTGTYTGLIERLIRAGRLANEGGTIVIGQEA
ncbi:MAG: hypothetical protein KDE58_33325 [Caldilineaceae bacterium]|nr:hypothetical protein [Caldilineaceae bacterium]